MASFRRLHEWDLTPSEAVALQRELRSQVRVEPLRRPIRTIAGADISFDKGSSVVYAGVVVLSLPSLQMVEEATVVTEARFPYVPGLLSFRESPCLLEAWAMLKTEPDAIMIDGHGYAHPRRAGIACHFGLLVERPSLGCAKSVLVGKYEEPSPGRGAWTPLVDKGEVVGAALRTKDRTTPVYVTVGHLIDLESAIELTMACGGGYRIPEPTRRAHLLVNAVRRSVG
jgi:deoxyribonuclease V